MSMTANQESVFQINAGYAADQLGTLILGFVFAVLVVYGAWAIRTAYVGWCEQKITKKEFLAVVVRFVCIYLILSFLLLS